MIYSPDKTNYKNFDVFEKNKLEARSYFIPFSCRRAADGVPVPLARYKSDRVTLLSGEWQFKYYKKLSEIGDKIDTATMIFDAVDVPSDWQRTGYEPPVYINTRYAFKLDPPNIPDDGPCAVYRKRFSVDDLRSGYILTFLGVTSGFDVYVNGSHAGYSEGSHNSAEFDVSFFLKRGVNELIVIVYKWTNGSYLECQDMFRENGIFRDVYLTEINADYIYDYEFKTTKINGKYDIRLTINGKFSGDCELEAIVAAKDGRVVGRKVISAESKTLIMAEGLVVDEWSAEIPNVYYLEITLKKDGREMEFIRDIIGFKTIDIDGPVFKLNDKAIKILGVNRHDTDPVKGFVMSALQLEGDVRLMKRYNINAVRTAHYPPDPIFLMYCDLYGLYVIDEADIETHGCYAVVYKPDLISHDKRWENRFVDRVKRMQMRDKNRASIVMWSLGNEAGGYNNQDSAYAYLKEVCPEIPVHYEAVCRTVRFRYDVTSEMYPSYDRIKKYGEGKIPKKYRGAPYFLCEYCHAMGVGPGGLKEMTDLFFSNDLYLGGCIWEWADHAVYNKTGAYKYTYGGDHGEEIHDGNFCVDGLVYPDRRPHTGLLNAAVCYSPFRVIKTGTGSFEFFNRNFFRRSDYALVKYSVQRDGREVAAGSLEFDIAPSSSAAFKLDCGEPPAPKSKKEKIAAPINADVYVSFEYIDKTTLETIAKEQLCASVKPFAASAENSASGALSCRETKEAFIVEFAGGSVVVGKYSGDIERITADGRDYLNADPRDGIIGIYDNIYRALLDNDNPIKNAVTKAGYASAAPYVKSAVKSDKLSSEGKIVILIDKYLVDEKGKTLFKLRVAYGVTPRGSIFVETKFKKAKRGRPLLLRVGYAMELADGFDRIKYYGRGPSENLPDFKEHAYVGVYEQKISDMHEPYIRPQDNGYHTDARRVEVTDGEGRGLVFEAVGAPLGFSAHDYTQRELDAAAHQEDLPRRQGAVFLNIDGFVSGAGSGSCGPMPAERFLLRPDKKYEYKFVIKTLK